MIELTGLGGLLRLIGVLFWIIVIAALIAALVLPKTRRGKVMATLIVVGLFAAFPGRCACEEKQRRDAGEGALAKPVAPHAVAKATGLHMLLEKGVPAWNTAVRALTNEKRREALAALRAALALSKDKLASVFDGIADSEVDELRKRLRNLAAMLELFGEYRGDPLEDLKALTPFEEAAREGKHAATPPGKKAGLKAVEIPGQALTEKTPRTKAGAAIEGHPAFDRRNETYQALLRKAEKFEKGLARPLNAIQESILTRLLHGVPNLSSYLDNVGAFGVLNERSVNYEKALGVALLFKSVPERVVLLHPTIFSPSIRHSLLPEEVRDMVDRLPDVFRTSIALHEIGHTFDGVAGTRLDLFGYDGSILKRMEGLEGDLRQYYYMGLPGRDKPKAIYFPRELFAQSFAVFKNPHWRAELIRQDPELFKLLEGVFANEERQTPGLVRGPERGADTDTGRGPGTADGARERVLPDRGRVAGGDTADGAEHQSGGSVGAKTERAASPEKTQKNGAVPGGDTGEGLPPRVSVRAVHESLPGRRTDSRTERGTAGGGRRDTVLSPSAERDSPTAAIERRVAEQEAWTIKRLRKGLPAVGEALRKMNALQRDLFKRMVESMRPVDATNPFWQRNALEEGLRAKMTRRIDAVLKKLAGNAKQASVALPMRYPIRDTNRLRPELRGKYSPEESIAALIPNGDRTGTTRANFGGAKIGDIVTFHTMRDGQWVEVPGQYRVTGFHPVDLGTPEGREEWSRHEGWSVEASKAFGNQVRTGATQMRFERVDTGESARSEDSSRGSPKAVAGASIELPERNYFTAKDRLKSRQATQFIGRGSPASSTAAYGKAWGALANTGKYSADDVVFVSTEGARGGRLAPDFAMLQKALDAGATIITDRETDRARPYNLGEREVAKYLQGHGYEETSPGRWGRKTNKVSPKDDFRLEPPEPARESNDDENFARKILQDSEFADGELTAKLYAEALEAGLRTLDRYEAIGLDNLSREQDQLYEIGLQQAFGDTGSVSENKRAVVDYLLEQGASENEISEQIDRILRTIHWGQEVINRLSYSLPAVDVKFSRMGVGAKENESFRKTERAYGGHAAYARARAVGRTELDYWEWVQARTPEFKSEFGDWEALRAQNRLDAMKPVEIRVPDTWKSLSLNDLRAKVREAMEAMKKDEPLHHPEIGEVVVGSEGVRKSLDDSRDPAKLFVLGDLRQAFEKSVFSSAKESENREQERNILAYEKLLAKIRVGEKELVAIFSVKNQSDGRHYYNTVTLRDGQEKTSAVSPGGPSASAGRSVPAYTEVNSFIRHPLVRVNPASVTAAINPKTGEPSAEVFDSAASAQSAESRSRQANEAEIEAAREHFTRTLGDGVKVEFKKYFNDNSSGRWEKRATQNVITLALNAANFLGTAYHESLHEFFDILSKHGDEAVRELLSRVSQNPIILRQLHKLLKDDAAAIAQLADPHESAAYMYQFWQAGVLKIGPTTRNFFQKIFDFLADVLGLTRKEIRDMRAAEE
ncbi:MAG: hypothetical protein LBI87_03695, partial [Candidatus Accumulibacter sp.]|nr:hypothetical protein [Accumulibacter sp.]